MTLDIIAGIVVLLALVAGWGRGFLFQAGQIVVLIIAWALGRAFADTLTPHIQPWLSTSAPVAKLVAFFGIFLLVYLVASFFLKRLIRGVQQASETIATGDRALGMIVGGLKGAAFVYLAVAGLLISHKMTGKLALPYETSKVASWVAEHNLVEEDVLPRGKALLKLAYILEHKDQAELANDAHVRAILENPRAQAVFEPDTLKALQERDYVALVGNPKIWEALDDPEIQAHLDAIDVPEAPKLPAEQPPSPI